MSTALEVREGVSHTGSTLAVLEIFPDHARFSLHISGTLAATSTGTPEHLRQHFAAMTSAARMVIFDTTPSKETA